MEFTIGEGGNMHSTCGRYVIARGFSAAHGCTVYIPWRIVDEYTWDVPLGEFFRLPYAEAACATDAGV